MKLTLYHYWRSTSSWRVRWALAHKHIECDYVHVHLLKGETETPEHLARNPFGYVPVLGIEAVGNPMRYLSESLAIIQWLEQAFPQAPKLLPADPFLAAQAWQYAEIINADTHPIQNLTVLERVSDDAEKRKEWSRYFIDRGLSTYETLAQKTAGRYTIGDTLTLADLCLLPQVYNAERNEMDLSPYPTVSRICDALKQLDSYRSSHPSRYEPRETP